MNEKVDVINTWTETVTVVGSIRIDRFQIFMYSCAAHIGEHYNLISYFNFGRNIMLFIYT